MRVTPGPVTELRSTSSQVNIGAILSAGPEHGGFQIMAEVQVGPKLDGWSDGEERQMDELSERIYR